MSDESKKVQERSDRAESEAPAVGVYTEPRERNEPGHKDAGQLQVERDREHPIGNQGDDGGK